MNHITHDPNIPSKKNVQSIPRIIAGYENMLYIGEYHILDSTNATQVPVHIKHEINMCIGCVQKYFPKKFLTGLNKDDSTIICTIPYNTNIQTISFI